MNIAKGAESVLSDEGWYETQLLTRERLESLARLDEIKASKPLPPTK